MKKQKTLFLSIVFCMSSAYGQGFLYGSADTLRIPGNCELIVPKLCDRYDYWYLRSDCDIETFSLSVFDRWGEAVFSTDTWTERGFVIGRDRSKNVNLPDGIYYWIIDIKTRGEIKKTVSGTVEIGQFIE